MEPPLPPLHPLLPELLEHLQLRVVDAIKWNVLACVEADDPGIEPTLILKFGSDERKTASINYEVRIMREVLPSLDQTLFERLALPEFVSDGEHLGVRWMTVRYMKGKPLVFSWSEVTSKADVLGGKGMDAGVGKMAVDLLADMRLVDTALLPKFVRRFQFTEWLDRFRREAPVLVQKGLLETRDYAEATRLFQDKRIQRFEGSMFTNGDFYPRNFILLPDGRIAVTDWVGGIDPWSFVAMYAWLMMWGNPEWQQTYVNELNRHFPVDIIEMQVGLLVRSFDLIQHWKDQPEEHFGVARRQMAWYFSQCLDVNFVSKIFAQ